MQCFHKLESVNIQQATELNDTFTEKVQSKYIWEMTGTNCKAKGHRISQFNMFNRERWISVKAENVSKYVFSL